MFDLVANSAKLFIAGKLFKDNALAVRQLAIGVARRAAIAIVVLSKIVPLWAATIVGAPLAAFCSPCCSKI